MAADLHGCKKGAIWRAHVPIRPLNCLGEKINLCGVTAGHTRQQAQNKAPAQCGEEAQITKEASSTSNHTPEPLVIG
eukprot:m.460080 g.460080  ORF g.460080 m.460080 type:complete len:77 (+) comp21589_c1_seq2:641-871(+)